MKNTGSVNKPNGGVKFTASQAEAARTDWGFNCGPGALCAVLGKTPEELRPHLRDFESKRYMNPTMIVGVLKDLDIKYSKKLFDLNGCRVTFPRLNYGLVRVQFDGSWMDDGVPVAARYRYTHWAAISGRWAFDINAMSISFDNEHVFLGGWIPKDVWIDQLIPWLIKESCPRGNGNWWATHGIEIL